MDNNDQKTSKTYYIAQGAVIAALYVALTVIFAPISFREVQMRIAEALTILPVFTPAAIPGLFIGCVVGNIAGGAAVPDVIFGSLATLAGAFVTYKIGKEKYYLAPVGPIAANTIVIPFVLKYAYGVPLPLWLSAIYIAIGEILSCGLLGILLFKAVKRIPAMNRGI